MPPDDLNDVALFDLIVTHGGINAASRAAGVAKSRLSRRLRHLEDKFGARLVERNTHSFCVTPLGHAFHAHCRRMLEEVRAAEATVQSFVGEPRGVLRVSVPPGPCAQAIAGMLPRFVADFPGIRVQILVGLRRFELIPEQIDVSVRVRSSLNTDKDLTAKRICNIYEVLVAAPIAFERFGAPSSFADLASWPIIGNEVRMGDASGRWCLEGVDGETRHVPYVAVAASDDPNVNVLMALAGLGAALVPIGIAQPELTAGRLKRMLPGWQTPSSTLHLVFPSRRGMLPAVRVFINRASVALLERFQAERASDGEAREESSVSAPGSKAALR